MLSDFNEQMVKAARDLGRIYSKYWIPVKQMLPPDDGVYLVTGETLGKEFTILCDYSKEFGWKTQIYDITAWMPLLPPYKGEKL